MEKEGKASNGLAARRQQTLQRAKPPVSSKALTSPGEKPPLKPKTCNPTRPIYPWEVCESGSQQSYQHPKGCCSGWRGHLVFPRGGSSSDGEMGAHLLLPARAGEGGHGHRGGPLQCWRRSDGPASLLALQNALLALIITPCTSEKVFVFPPISFRCNLQSRPSSAPG